MTAEAIREQINAALPRLKGLQAVVSFDLGADGKWVVDARAGDPSLVSSDSAVVADSTITISYSNLIKMLDGKLDPMVAYGLGRIKVRGSKGIAMKLVTALS